MKVPFLTLFLLMMLAGSVAVTAHTFSAPEKPGTLSNAQRTLSLTLYLTDALHLTYQQAQDVRAYSGAGLQQLAQAPNEAAREAARATFDVAVVRTLTPEQCQLYRRLRTNDPVIGEFLNSRPQ